MSIINSILKAFVGDKSEKDVKAIQPLVTKVKSFESALQTLSHDELRAKTSEFKSKIQQARADKDAKIIALKQEAEQTHFACVSLKFLDDRVTVSALFSSKASLLFFLQAALSICFRSQRKCPSM